MSEPVTIQVRLPMSAPWDGSPFTKPLDFGLLSVIRLTLVEVAF